MSDNSTETKIASVLTRRSMLYTCNLPHNATLTGHNFLGTAILIACRISTRWSRGMMLNENSNVKAGGDTMQQETTREEEQGDVAEPNAPTAEEESEGMNTVL